MSHRLPDLRFIIPAANENRWSDLLASLISTDPRPMAGVVGVEPEEVRREVAVPGASGRRLDRLDLMLVKRGEQVAVIEAKVLSDLGPQQLDRYRTAFPHAGAHLVLHLEGLPVNLRAAPGWGSLTWESVLTVYAESAHPWVADTAQAWLAQLDELVPEVSSGTVWNDVPDDAAGFELALRARVAWLSRRMDAWCDLPHELAMSSGGGTWVASMWTDASSRGQQVVAEIQEGLAAQEWRPDPNRPYRRRVRGPVVLVGLRQEGVNTSAGFDWPLLHRLFRQHVLDDAGNPADGRAWQLTPASPRDPTDRENWQQTLDAGAPRWLGKGYGMATARTHKVCAFGARLQLAPGSTLSEIDAEMQRLLPLVIAMGAT